MTSLRDRQQRVQDKLAGPGDVWVATASPTAEPYLEPLSLAWIEDPRAAGDPYGFLVLRPERIQAGREVDEIPGRTLMRDGAWLG